MNCYIACQNFDKIGFTKCELFRSIVRGPRKKRITVAFPALFSWNKNVLPFYFTISLYFSKESSLFLFRIDILAFHGFKAQVILKSLCIFIIHQPSLHHQKLQNRTFVIFSFSDELQLRYFSPAYYCITFKHKFRLQYR